MVLVLPWVLLSSMVLVDVGCFFCMVFCMVFGGSLYVSGVFLGVLVR